MTTEPVNTSLTSAEGKQLSNDLLILVKNYEETKLFQHQVQECRYMRIKSDQIAKIKVMNNLGL
jgi:hypothetical protein